MKRKKNGIKYFTKKRILKEGTILKLTLHFTTERLSKLNKLCMRDLCSKNSYATTIENIVNEKLDGMRL